MGFWVTDWTLGETLVTQNLTSTLCTGQLWTKECLHCSKQLGGKRL